MKSAKTLLKLLFLFTLSTGFSQKPKAYQSGEVKQLLKKLNVLGSVLYVGAHPDDENTRFIAYMANEELYRTAYLSATRGDGGQNLIGPEIREGLGIIRTNELLQARETDGGMQFFSRANDFGYSKNPEETLTIWDRDMVLSDFVRVIRKFRPDVIVTRFPADGGGGHGHHTTSAILALEAFKLANDPNVFPEQLKTLEVWQPKKIFWNKWFFGGGPNDFDKSKLIAVDGGLYNSNLGVSYSEIAAVSRTNHKSQGFGSTGSRGISLDYLEQWDGDSTTNTLFGTIDNTWKRVSGAERVSELLMMAEKSFGVESSNRTLSLLFQARAELINLPDQFWKEVKINELDEAIRAITGTYLEAVADDFTYVRGDSIKIKIEAISRLNSGFNLKSIVFEPWGTTVEINQKLEPNQKLLSDYSLVVPSNMSYSGHYWLNEKATLGMYYVDDPENIGKPLNDPVFNARFIIEWEDQYIEYNLPVNFKTNDPVDGESYRPIEISPEVMVNLNSDIMIFAGDQEKLVEARVIAGKANVSGNLTLNVPDGWKVSPSSINFDLEQKNEEKIFSFLIKGPPSAQEAWLNAVVKTNGSSLSLGRKVISYDHFPVQTYYPPAKIKLVKLDLNIMGRKIGYIDGAGDAIPENLSQVGYEVQVLTKDDVVRPNLMRFDAVILGVRAFNTVDWLSYKNKELFDYVKEGGTVIVQYNTSRGLVTDEIAPYPLKLSRDRVAVESAEIRVLASDHSIMNFPNKIKKEDFENWVQERGLYFPGEWSKEFTPILSSNDPGEDPKDGGLVVASYGKGYYIYSGYSWFRELPAGVSGAYRIFTNMISIGDSNKKID